jgi:hypothetical protein
MSEYTRVTVDPPSVQVDYVRCFLPEHENEQQVNGQVAYNFMITKPN